MLCVEHDQMIRALTPDRTDQAFNIAVLPGRAKRRGTVPDIPNEQEQLALSVLADKIRFAAHKSLDLWTQAYEAGRKSGAVS